MLTSTNPTGGSSAWNVTKVGSSSDDAGFLDGALTCASTPFCMLVDHAGSAFFATPTPGYVPPSQTPPPGPQTTPAPAANPTPSPAGSVAIPVVMPAPALSPVTTTGKQTVRPGTASPHVNRAAFATLLGRKLVPSGAAASPPVVGSRGHFDFVLDATEAGSAVFEWYEATPAGHAAGSPTARRILVASGRVTFTRARSLTIEVRLTAAGKRLVRHTKRVALTGVGRFTPSGGSVVTVSRKFELRS